MTNLPNQSRVSFSESPVRLEEYINNSGFSFERTPRCLIIYGKEEVVDGYSYRILRRAVPCKVKVKERIGFVRVFGGVVSCEVYGEKYVPALRNLFESFSKETDTDVRMSLAGREPLPPVEPAFSELNT